MRTDPDGIHATPERDEYDDSEDDLYPEDEYYWDDSEEDEDFDCSFISGQGCLMAGSEECDWECPYRKFYYSEIEEEEFVPVESGGDELHKKNCSVFGR